MNFKSGIHNHKPISFKKSLPTIYEAGSFNEVDEISDFGTGDNDSVAETIFLHKEETQNFIQEQVETKVVGDLVEDCVRKILTVKSFLVMVILRKRYRKI